MTPKEVIEKIERHRTHLAEVEELARIAFVKIVNGDAPVEDMRLAVEAWKRFLAMMKEQEGMENIMLVPKLFLAIGEVDLSTAFLENIPDDGKWN